ncbi:MAG: response regulator transcription factor [Armatimonadetes bacterium]|jgi:DNA-binding response OmpR family regulator|nr:response regulator transcription factor [Armatimonadota bacterium]
MATARVLIIEDEAHIVEVLTWYLREADWEVFTASDGESGLALARLEEPDAIILDLMLPGLDGLEVCRRLRQESRVPILVLTARDGETDKIQGLEAGADDYVTKPFSSREVVARVKALLRRARYTEPLTRNVLSFPGLEIDRAAYTVSVAGRPARLTPMEFQVLALLASQPGRAFSRDEIITRVSGVEYIDARTVDVHIRHLRAKIEPDPSRPRYLHTVWGVGYKFEVVG